MAAREKWSDTAVARASALTIALAAAIALATAGCPADPTGPTEGRVDLEWQPIVERHQGGALLSGWGTGPGDAWFVGGEAGAPLVLHLEGETWTRHDPGNGAQLWWVHGLAGGPVVMVGDGGSIVRFEAGAWSVTDTGLPGATLYGVWMASATDAWAVGGPSAAAPAEVEREADVLLRYDGSSWTRVDLPALSGRTGQRNLFKVWGAASDDVFIVGSAGLVLHWDGAAWTTQDSGTSAALFTVAGRASGDVWAVGGGGRPALIHYDGATWSDVELPELAPQILQGLWTAPGNAVYVSGFNGFTARLDDGGRWVEGEIFTPYPLHGLWGDRQGAIWTFGGDIMSVSPQLVGVLGVAGRAAPTLSDTADLDGGDDGGATDQHSSDTSDASEDDGDDDDDAGPADSGDDGPADSGDDGASDAQIDLETSQADASDAEMPSDAVQAGCDEVHTSCPASHPRPGWACSGDLSCPYESEFGVEWSYACVAGAWVGTDECADRGCIPAPAVEVCDAPFDGTLPGATVEVGPSDPTAAFRPFTTDEEITLEWGSQGMPMVVLRVRIAGAPEDLRCAYLDIAMTTSAETSGTNLVNAGVVCGETLGTWTVLPPTAVECDPSLFDLHVDVTVQGVGVGSADLTFRGGGSPFCPGP